MLIINHIYIYNIIGQKQPILTHVYEYIYIKKKKLLRLKLVSQLSDACIVKSRENINNVSGTAPMGRRREERRWEEATCDLFYYILNLIIGDNIS